MEKNKLNRFIAKYFLNGCAESVVWKSDKDLLVKFVDDTKSLVGEVTYENANFGECEFGINQTSKLKTLLGVVGDTIEIDIKTKNDMAVALDISDSNVDVNYVLSDISIIPKVPVLKTLPHWNLVLNVDNKFVDSFIKASNALSDVKEFAILAKNDKVTFVIGHHTMETTKVSINIDVKNYSDTNVVYFSTLHLKEILVANKDAKNGKIEVSDKGLMKISFHVDEYKSTYFLISKQDVSN